MSKEAMKKALDALVGWKEYMPALFDEDDEKAITALREAMAEQPTQQEPVGVFREDDDIGRVYLCPQQQMKLKDGDKLYTTPPAQRKPLTDEEIKAVVSSIDPDEQYLPKALKQLARAIEAAHGIKE